MGAQICWSPPTCPSVSSRNWEAPRGGLAPQSPVHQHVNLTYELWLPDLQELGSGARVPTWQEALELLSSETPGWGGRTPKSAKQPVLERGRKGSLHGGLPEGGGIWRCRTSRTPPRPKDRRTAAEAAAPTRPPPFPEPGRPGRGAGADRKAPSPARPPPPGGPYPRRYLHVGRRGLMAPGPRSALRARVRAAAMETGLCVAEEGPERAGAAGPAPDGEGTEGRRVRPGFGPRAAPFLCPLLPQDGAAPTVKTLQPGQQPRSAPGSGKSQAWAPGGAPDQPQAAKCPRSPACLFLKMDLWPVSVLLCCNCGHFLGP
ncbi:translation initiation factor IF-2-like isoform X2 [Elephas maximus indicus]|uniref:translation initiation factor IF-2-like isoform X2 n=1 Tax=Elephas maximus indicus TaxID=99487 RepID=UPI002115E303|nr:translation initiation factor IF-2-like isoform X2 [Elephas maximus indicus]